MLESMSEEMNEPTAPTFEPPTEAPASKPEKAAKAKPKPQAKPKPAAPPANNGPLYLLLSANGKYRELQEAELVTEAAGVLKDPTLRLVKASAMTPQISFRLADE